MEFTVRAFRPEDTAALTRIWNEVIEAGRAFPQLEYLDGETGQAFFREQTYTGVAEADGVPAGLYILHPNNVGRCGHICNASYAVLEEYRGRHMGEALVRNSLRVAKEKGFRVMQFNAVVAENKAAVALYEKIGFVRLGTVPEGFLLKDGRYSDIILYYYVL